MWMLLREEWAHCTLHHDEDWKTAQSKTSHIRIVSSWSPCIDMLSLFFLFFLFPFLCHYSHSSFLLHINHDGDLIIITTPWSHYHNYTMTSITSLLTATFHNLDHVGFKPHPSPCKKEDKGNRQCSKNQASLFRGFIVRFFFFLFNLLVFFLFSFLLFCLAGLS